MPMRMHNPVWLMVATLHMSYDTSDDLPDNNSISVVGDDATDELPGFIYSSLAGDDQEELDSVRDDVNIHSSRNDDLNTSQDDL